MLPTDVFHDLIDARVAFTVASCQSGSRFNVVPAKDGSLRLSRPDDKNWIGADPQPIFGRLNALLCDERPGEGLIPEPHISLHAGRAMDVRVESNPVRKGRSFDPFIVRSLIVQGDYPDEVPRRAVFETDYRGTLQLWLAELCDGVSLSGITRLSPYALPRTLHARIAAGGTSTMAVDFRAIFIGRHGTEAMAAADNEQMARWQRWQRWRAAAGAKPERPEA